MAKTATITSNDDGKNGKQTVVEFVYSTLKRNILENLYPPGFNALEKEIADQLGVSTTPVREALTRLQDESLVERLPRRGFRVLPLTVNDLRELRDLIYCLEARAVELFTESAPAANDERLAALVEINTRVAKAIEDDDRRAWADADWDFHHLLLKYSGNERLTKVGFGVWDQFHRADIITLNMRPKPVNSAIEHDEILEAVRSHDPERARASVLAHRWRGGDAIVDALEKFGLKQV